MHTEPCVHFDMHPRLKSLAWRRGGRLDRTLTDHIAGLVDSDFDPVTFDPLVRDGLAWFLDTD